MVKGAIKKLVAATSLGLCLAGATARCGSDDGFDVKGNYPELTPEIKRNLESKVIDLVEEESDIYMIEEIKEESMPFEGTPKELINYFIGFTQEEYKAEGISMPGLEGLKISVMQPNELDEACGGDANGCIYDNHIYIKNFDIGMFFAIFNHEFGHWIGKTNLEYPSVANTIYSSIKTYEFSKTIGSLFLEKTMFHHSLANADLSEIEPAELRYKKAGIFSIVNLLDYDGNVERAMDHIAHTRLLTIETQLKDKLDEYKETNHARLGLMAWDDLLDSPILEAAMSQDHSGLAPSEISEFISYLRIALYREMVFLFRGDSEIESRYSELLDMFEKNYSYINPHFRAEIVLELSNRLYGRLQGIAISGGIRSDSVYELAKRIVDMNKQYPCEMANPYECPKGVRSINQYHPGAYYYLSLSAFGSDNAKQRTADGYAIEFLEKFYKGLDFNNSNFGPLKGVNIETHIETNNFVPIIAFNAGVSAMKYDYSLAEKFFTAAVSVQCLSSGIGPGLSQCSNKQFEAKWYLECLKNPNCKK